MALRLSWYNWTSRGVAKKSSTTPGASASVACSNKREKSNRGILQPTMAGQNTKSQRMSSVVVEALRPERFVILIARQRLFLLRRKAFPPPSLKH